MSDVRRSRSLRDLCDALDGPPPLRRSCCVRIPKEIVKNPDPSTYDTEAVFAGGGLPSFNSPDLDTVNIWPVAPIGKITAKVRNLSADASALRTRVDASWSAFGIGMERNPIGSSFVDLALAGAFGSEQAVAWPMPADATAAGRYGIFVDISHPYDRDLSNNQGQQTVDGLQTSNGRAHSFQVPVRNPSSETRTVNLAFSPAPEAAWATVTPASLTLAPFAVQNVTVAINVPAGLPVSPPGTLISATIDLVATSVGRLLGGVSFLILLDA